MRPAYLRLAQGHANLAAQISKKFVRLSDLLSSEQGVLFGRGLVLLDMSDIPIQPGLEQSTQLPARGPPARQRS